MGLDELVTISVSRKTSATRKRMVEAQRVVKRIEMSTGEIWQDS